MTYLKTQYLTLKDPYLQNAFQKNLAYLLSLDPKRLLFEWYRVAGLSPSTPSGYQGWERSDQVNFRGHFLGHYLSALALSLDHPLAEKDRQEVQSRIYFLVQELAAIQDKYGQDYPQSKGYLSAFGEVALDQVEGRDLKGQRPDPVLVPWYNLHKLLAGLLEVVKAGDLLSQATTSLALEIAQQFASYVAARVDQLEDKQFFLSIEYGGMGTALLDLYEITHNPRYYQAAQAFEEVDLIKDLASNKVVLPGKHANTTIPKLQAAMAKYQALCKNQELKSPLEKQDYLQASIGFWETVMNHHTYITGGNSQAEHFHQEDTLGHDALDRMGNCTCETCNSHNMLKLSQALYRVTGDKTYLDYQDRTWTNAILPSQNPHTGMVQYFQPMGWGYNKVYSQPQDQFWCCHGTGIESFAKIGQLFYVKKGDQLILSQYFSHQRDFRQENIRLLVETKQCETTLSLQKLDPNQDSLPLSLAFRLPYWAQSFQVLDDQGQPLDHCLVEGIIYLAQDVQVGDQVTLRFVPQMIWSFTRDLPTYGALQYGPWVMAADLGPDTDKEWVPNGILVQAGHQKEIYPDWINLGGLGDQETMAKHAKVSWDSSGYPQIEFPDKHFPWTFVPYAFLHDAYYGLYLHWHKPETEKEEEAGVLRLDHFDQNNAEYAWGLSYQDSQIGQAHGKTYRQARGAGWFSYLLPIEEPGYYDLEIEVFGEEGEVQVQPVLNGTSLESQASPDQGWSKLVWTNLSLEKQPKISFANARIYGLSLKNVD